MRRLIGRLSLSVATLALLCSGMPLGAPAVNAASATDAGPSAAPVAVAAPVSAAPIATDPEAQSFSAPVEKGFTVLERDKSSDPNADSQVRAVIDSAISHGASAALATAKAGGLVVSGSQVHVIVEASDLAQAKSSIAAAGATVEATAGDLIQVRATPGQLAGLTSAAGVNFVRAPMPHFADAVTDEGVASTNALAQQQLGKTGAGVKVAVIDVGFLGLHAAQLDGDLPASVTTVDYCSGYFDMFTNHGTGVAEIVHKMAPDAVLYLICVGGEVELAEAEAYVKAQGITIVNHSVSWFNSSRGDGTGAAGSPDATVADATANGILWVNSAGNYAKQHWTGRFVDNGHKQNVFATVGGVKDIGDSFWLDDGQSTCVSLKWDNWPRTAQDYDLYIVQESSDEVVASSEDTQTGTQPPVEITCYENPTGVGQWFFVGIMKYKATTTPRFDLFLANIHFVRNSDLKYASADGSVAEPASAPAAFAVGAMCWQDTTIEPYSSQGPTINGTVKPDITGPDQTSGSAYGSFTSCTDMSGFAGTSAAAPHVAGAAALLKGANPSFTPAQIKTYLQTNALDLGAAGKDNVYGSGSLILPSPPFAPTAVTGIGYNTSALISWVAPANNGGKAITGYTVTPSPDGAPCTTTGALTCTVTGLTNGNTYTFTVTANNSQGTGPASDPSAGVIPIAVPDAPVVTALGLDQEIKISWTAASGNGSDVLAYSLTSNPAGLSCAPAPTDTLACDFTGLTNSTYYTISVTAQNSVGVGPAAVVTIGARVGSSFVPLTPNRILDSHVAKGIATPLAANTGTEFTVTNQIPGTPGSNVPTGAVAVTGVLSVSNSTAAGYLSLSNARNDHPTTSTLNFPKADARATGVTVPLSATGTLWVTYAAASGKADVAFDVTGYFVLGSSGSTYHALTPNRIVDSRSTFKIGITTGQLTAGTHKNFAVLNRTAGVATTNVPNHAVAVTGTLTVAGQTAAGRLTLGPDAGNSPTTASLYFPKGDNRATGLTVMLAPDGSLNVTFTSATAGAKTDVIFDVNGYFVADQSGAMYVPVTPNRLVDSRPTVVGGHTNTGLATALRSYVAQTFQVTGRVPADATQNVPAGATAVTGILTVVNQTAAGFLSLTNVPVNVPTTSSMNFPLGDIRATGVTVPLSPSGGKLSVTYGAAAGKTTHVIFDVSGYFVN
jgi:hypothetical protein